MKTLLGVIMAVGIVLSAGSAYADVSYQPIFGFDSSFNPFPALDASGSVIDDGTYLMVLDIDGDGWDGASSYELEGVGNADSWLWDSDDLLLDRGAITTGLAAPNGYLTGDPTQIPGYDVNVDNWYVIWLDLAYDELATSPGDGVAYGVALAGQAGANGFSLTPPVAGGVANLETHAVPEPVSSVLALIGAGALAVRRRFTRKVA